MSHVKPEWVLFDWGDTLMVDLPEYSGPMATWPRVEMVANARDTLECLRVRGWQLALATNADDSQETDIRAALARVGLNEFIDRVYCSRTVGHKKPSLEFFEHIERDLGRSAADVVMVGDNYGVDIVGANAAGIRAVWLCRASCSVPAGVMHRVIADLSELPDLLAAWT